MARSLVPNPPRFDMAQTLASKRAKKPSEITPLLRTALLHVFEDQKHYETFVEYFRGGEVTGSRIGDAYAVARLVVEWEAEATRTELHDMLYGPVASIRLVDVVKRLAPELRRFGFDVRRSVIVGITHKAG